MLSDAFMVKNISFLSWKPKMEMHPLLFNMGHTPSSHVQGIMSQKKIYVWGYNQNIEPGIIFKIKRIIGSLSVNNLNCVDLDTVNKNCGEWLLH